MAMNRKTIEKVGELEFDTTHGVPVDHPGAAAGQCPELPDPQPTPPPCTDPLPFVIKGPLGVGR